VGVGEGGHSEHGGGGVIWVPPYIRESGKVGTLHLFVYLHGCCQVTLNMCMGDWGGVAWVKYCCAISSCITHLFFLHCLVPETPSCWSTFLSFLGGCWGHIVGVWVVHGFFGSALLG